MFPVYGVTHVPGCSEYMPWNEHEPLPVTHCDNARPPKRIQDQPSRIHVKMLVDRNDANGSGDVHKQAGGKRQRQRAVEDEPPVARGAEKITDHEGTL